ncbi:protein Hikeshi-like [Branchiostoma floridae]|uniref:Protein Hikeshi n=1 Tax=Branchiostoma floridae TaxID=7739 RepID=A0A9J7L920_BRAFL|nr:protein Hikeshi-like [Branchiostoma floridae]
MFGCIVAGRLVQTDPQQMSETQFVFTLSDADSINHIVVFLTGTTPFPDGLCGAVYFGYPNPDGMAWQFLGYIANDKPSAIFKVAKVKPGDETSNTVFGQLIPGQQKMAQIGISVEPLAQVTQQTPPSHITPSTVSSFQEFTRKMLESFHNYASSFALTQAQMVPEPNKSFVPLNVLQQWFDNFQRRLAQNPNFWKT